MDNIIEFEKIDSEPLIGSFIKNDVDAIYKLVTEEKLAELTPALTQLSNKLISHCNKEQIQLNSYSFDDSAKEYFSQFLQYFFYSILKMEIEVSYKKEILVTILKDYADTFYYYHTFHDQKKIHFGQIK